MKILSTFSNGKKQIVALNVPQGWDIFSGQQEFSIGKIKTASIDKAVDDDIDGFDIKAAVKKNPDHLFVKVLAIKKDEVNQNGDAFNEEELKKAASSFIGVPVFCNHQNDDIEKARGMVVHAWYDDDKGGIWTINMVDKIAYPKLARGIEEGYITGTSMGCQVQYSICSICHNKAFTSEEYCSHVKNSKTRKFNGKIKCAFSKSKNRKSDEKCPLCSEENEINHKEALVHEWNYGLKFIEDSFVVNPACQDCLVECILNVPELNKKSAEVSHNLRKVASTEGFVKVASATESVEALHLVEQINHVIAKANKLGNSEYTEKFTKVSGKIEIQNLNQAMKLMEVVAKSMMTQKEQVSMEYVSDLVDVLASLQTITDELIEMGYPGIQSPANLENPNAIADASPIPGANITNQTQPGVMPAPSVQPQQAQQGGQIGSVTKPTFASNDEKIKDLIVTIPYTVEELELVIKNQVQSAIASNINKNLKESDTMPNPTEKTAAGNGVTSDVAHKTTEKQLQEAKNDLHPRTESFPSGITESDKQLGGKEQVNDTSSDSGQVRKNDPSNVTTEGQLAAYTGTDISRWNSFPSTILEKNWTDLSRAIGSELSKDQKDHITEGQLKDLLDHHRWTEPKVTTEGQLGSSENWLNSDNAWLSKSAADYSKALVSSAINSITDAIVNYNITPNEIVKAASVISKDPQSQIKAAFLVLVNGMPGKKASRQTQVAKARYFNTNQNVSPVDAVLACAGDNCLNLKAEDLVDAIIHISKDTKKMAKVEVGAKEKIASISTPEIETVVDKFAAFDEAFNELEKKEVVAEEAVENNDSGLHVIELNLSDIAADISDQPAFVLATEKAAKNKFAGNTETVLVNIDMDEELGYVEATLKEFSKLSEKEKVALAAQADERRNSIKKEAQMMGGELGGGMGGGAGGPGGQGATMPTPDGAGAPPAPPVESFSDQPVEGEDAGNNAEAKPPGSICPVCGTQDVDIVAGKGRCNNTPECGAEFVYKVQVDVTKWPGVTDTNSSDDDSPELNEEVGDASEDGMGSSGEGFEMPGGEGADASIPVAAMTRLNPEVLKKLAAKNPNYKVGSISPLTGSSNTHHIAGNEWLCMDTGRTYKVAFAIDPKDVKNVYAEWSWTPRLPSDECSSCQRAKIAWKKALASVGLTNQQFSELSFKKRAETILDMHSKGAFNVVKTASKGVSVTSEIKKAYEIPASSFPMEACKAKIAKRFGENAIALSGPNRGSNLADCVCNQLKGASVYSDKIAIKVADTWADKDACVDCIEAYVRAGLSIEKSSTVCQYLKLKYADSISLFAEDLTDNAFNELGKGSEEEASIEVTPDVGGDEIAKDFDDPFADGQESDISIDVGPEGIEVGTGDIGGPEVDTNLPDVTPGDEHGTVVIKLPLSALDAIEEAIDVAHGENPSDEAHHDLPGDLADKEVEVELPGDTAEGIEDAVEPVLDNEIGEPSDDSESDDSSESDEDGGADDMGFGDEGGNEPKEPKSPIDGGGSEIKEGDDMEKDHLASYMRRGKISGSGEINLDVDAIAKAIGMKVASEPKLEKAQDAVSGYSNGGTIGEEEKFKADKPKVPRGEATMGEGEENPKDKPLPDVFTGNANMGAEKELGYTSDGASLSGGNDGAGKTETANSKQTKKATKLENAKPVSETDGLDVPRSNKDHALTPDSVKRETVSEKDFAKIPEKGEGARIDGEVDNGSVPKADKAEYTPDIPVGDASLKGEEKSNKEYAPEKELAHKGTVIAKSNEKSKEVESEAVRLAGRMVEEKVIVASELLQKITELKQYDLSMLKQIEKTLFTKVAKKGLATGPDGVEQPVIISQASNETAPRNKDAEFQAELQGLFTLDKRNQMANRDDVSIADLRKVYNNR